MACAGAPLDPLAKIAGDSVNLSDSQPHARPPDPKYEAAAALGFSSTSYDSMNLAKAMARLQTELPTNAFLAIQSSMDKIDEQWSVFVDRFSVTEIMDGEVPSYLSDESPLSIVAEIGILQEVVDNALPQASEYWPWLEIGAALGRLHDIEMDPNKHDQVYRIRQAYAKLRRGLQKCRPEHLATVPALSMWQQASDSEDALFDASILGIPEAPVGNFYFSETGTVGPFFKATLGFISQLRKQEIARDPLLEERDKYIFEAWWRGTRWKEIVAYVRGQAKWTNVSLRRARAAAIEYATRHELELPPPRKGGRPPSS